MSLPVVLRREARAEFDEAADWYERQRPGVGTDFVIRVNGTLSRIAAAPRLHAKIFQDVRRVMVPKFPYAVLYIVEPDRIAVIAVFHSRRDPAVWQGRI